jgi:hypothetical protein
VPTLIRFKLPMLIPVAAVAGILLPISLGSPTPARAPLAQSGAKVSQFGLASVSCPSTRFCMAIGTSTKGTQNEVPRAYAWDAKGWALQAVPTPTGSTTNYLNSVTCPTAKWCMAVGGYDNHKDLAEVWNGTAWSIVSSSNPPFQEFSTLDGVACTSTKECIAVGTSSKALITPWVPVAEIWNGKRWSIQSTPNIAGASQSQFMGVSCPSAKWCLAVGYTMPASGGSSTNLVEVWDGTAWSIQPTANVTKELYNSLSGVSCVSDSSCAAVGYYSTGSRYFSLAEEWNGTAWSIQATHDAGINNRLADVACSAASTCIAVGSSANYAKATSYLWNGIAWTAQSVITPVKTTGDQLEGVTCVSTTWCTVVGASHTTTDRNMAALWNGTGWKLEKTPY